MSRTLIIGSRGSDLALWQANFTKNKLEKLGHQVEIKIIKTQGDKIQGLSFDKMEGKGFFTKELEEALLDQTIDLAVHSHKDLPTTYPAGLTIGAVSYREDCSETILIAKDAYDPEQLLNVKPHGRIGTSSVRRSSQLQFFRPDLNILQLRGNVPTRIQKLSAGGYDAIMLASAGLERLAIDLSEFEVQRLNPRWFIPAPAQGVLAYQIREKDTEMLQILAQIHDPDVARQIWIERNVLNRLNGGCQLPLGVYVEREDEQYRVWSSLKPLDGAPLKRFYLEGIDAEQLTAKLLKGFETELKGKIFITREPHQCKVFTRLLEGMGFQVTAKSLIKTEASPFVVEAQYDWLFFTSANAVKYFLEGAEHDEVPKKLAAIGPGTELALSEFGYEASFVGDPTLTTHEIGLAFGEKNRGQKILFPQSNRAMQHVADAVANFCEVTKLVVYHTRMNTHRSIPEADILVFTSPSNVESYIELKGKPEQPCIAIGNTTANALKKQDIANHFLAPMTDQLAMADIAAGLMLQNG